MPDFTTHSGTWCASNEGAAVTVRSESGKEYTVQWARDYRPNRQTEFNWFCNCKGFQFRKTCKHVEEAKSKICHWNWEMEPNGARKECPKCGGETRSFRVGV